jgi:hypothetical protein
MKMKNIIVLSFVIALALMLTPSQAQVTAEEMMDGVIISRIAPSEAQINQKFWITLVIENKQNSEKNIIIRENLKDADFDQTEAKFITTEYGEKFWYYEWKIKLGPQENTSVTYWLIPKTSGTYVISPAEISVDNEKFYLKSWVIKVRCNANEKCEQGENYLNCPEDCITGASDEICDSLVDGRCDPDCEKGADPDCEKLIAKGIPNLYIIIGIIIIVIAGAILIPRFLKKRKVEGK